MILHLQLDLYFPPETDQNQLMELIAPINKLCCKNTLPGQLNAYSHITLDKCTHDDTRPEPCETLLKIIHTEPKQWQSSIPSLIKP